MLSPSQKTPLPYAKLKIFRSLQFCKQFPPAKPGNRTGPRFRTQREWAFFPSSAEVSLAPPHHASQPSCACLGEPFPSYFAIFSVLEGPFVLDKHREITCFCSPPYQSLTRVLLRYRHLSASTINIIVKQAAPSSALPPLRKDLFISALGEKFVWNKGFCDLGAITRKVGR